MHSVGRSIGCNFNHATNLCIIFVNIIHDTGSFDTKFPLELPFVSFCFVGMLEMPREMQPRSASEGGGKMRDPRNEVAGNGAMARGRGYYPKKFCVSGIFGLILESNLRARTISFSA